MVIMWLLASCSVVVPDDQFCTEIGCADQVGVSFERTLWPAGDYTVTVTLDGDVTECAVTLPFASCDIDQPCTGDDAVLLELSGCALADDEHYIPGVMVMASPDLMVVSVSQDGTELGTETFEPEYETSQPNGEGCEPTCYTAPSGSMTLDR
jgi:hypothetical protein